MSDSPRNKILFVDDEPCMREIMAMLLVEEGYEVTTAFDGFDALAQLRICTPNLIISDLTMPRMSGVEFLSVVRRRFPSIPVIAISGAYSTSDNFPTGVMADAFYPKSRCHPNELMSTVAELIHTPTRRATNYRPCQPPAVQNGRMFRDTEGIPSITLTCSDCLRAFPLQVPEANGQGVQEAACVFCSTPIAFQLEPSYLDSHRGVLNSLTAASASAQLN